MFCDCDIFYSTSPPLLILFGYIHSNQIEEPTRKGYFTFVSVHLQCRQDGLATREGAKVGGWNIWPISLLADLSTCVTGEEEGRRVVADVAGGKHASPFTHAPTHCTSAVQEHITLCFNWNPSSALVFGDKLTTSGAVADHQLVGSRITRKLLLLLLLLWDTFYSAPLF